MHKKADGFSLIEIIIAVTIVAIVTAIAVTFVRRRPVKLQEHMLRELNNLTRTAQLNALTSGKLQRVLFDFKQNKINIESASDQRDSQGKIQFKPLQIPYTTTSRPLIQDAHIEKFMIKDKDLMQQAEGVSYTGAWFYITPNGMAQELTLTIKDQKTGKTFSLTMNPFTAQLSAD